MMPDSDFNLYRRFQRPTGVSPDKFLLTTESADAWTYAKVDQEAARLAGFMTQCGLNPGDRVSVQVEKSPAALCLYLACLRGGFVFHPLNPAYQAKELEYFLTNAEPSLVVCDSAREEEIRRLTRSLQKIRVETLNADGSGSLIEASRGPMAEVGVVPRQSEDLAALLYSSGTTGLPKGIMLTHGNLLSNMQALVSAWGFSSQDRLLHVLPIFHVHGLFVAIGCVMLSGASMRWLSAFTPEKAIRFLPECTVMMGVPTHYTRLLGSTDLTQEACRNIRVFISGSAPLQVDTFHEFESRTGHRILERYGMTETNMNTSNPLNAKRKPGTVGFPLPGVEVRVTADGGGIVPRDTVGNLEVRGPNVFAGYWRMPEKTAEDFTDDGFFKTGDMGRIDEEGYVSIDGRAKDLVITGGLNVYPKEVELFIDSLPGVKESAVIGVPHPDYGEAVVAVVVPDGKPAPEEQEIIRAVKDNLAGFKVPKRVFLVEELPRNTMAKVQKSLLREQYRTLFS